MSPHDFSFFNIKYTPVAAKIRGHIASPRSTLYYSDCGFIHADHYA
jgi:hypothetical protein